MKQLVKGIGQYIKESEEADREELASMGFSDKISLEYSDEIGDKIDDLFYGDEEANRLANELEARVKALAKEFQQKYEWDSAEMDSVYNQMAEYNNDDPTVIATAVVDAIYRHLT